MTKIIRKDTLVLVTKSGQQILLGLKKRGFGCGKWNGFGGKVEMNETIEEAAKRELLEESNLKCNDMKKVGILSFEFVNDLTAPKHLEIHVFHTEDYWGEVQESDEMMPKWFNIEDIPFNNMWVEDHLWFQLLLKGSRFRGFFKYSGQSIITEYILQELSKECKLDPIEY
ncbi:oxidized purine nucleoside triphosphate hydrolase-like [Oppia nitens]|uniref:oxidized purine nucleoside triphosphate hydrolase-like n=1 Tax=Oppia nitens TaxID=1686743 RepID=UPI0023DA5F57|nr:oxidized purine nucleoside triphosphate hydrolase-like [Oppia nitens]